MIADPEISRETFSIKKRLQSLGLPKQAKLVEADPDPKVTFNKIVAQAEAERRRKLRNKDLREHYEMLAQEVRLERLTEVLAYRKFSEKLTAAFITLNLIHSSHAGRKI